jgi:hypothetical protein
MDFWPTSLHFRAMSKSKPEAFALVLDQPVSQLGLDSGGVDAKEPAVNHV